MYAYGSDNFNRTKVSPRVSVSGLDKCLNYVLGM